jgi:hypothetical protein
LDSLGDSCGGANRQWLRQGTGLRKSRAGQCNSYEAATTEGYTCERGAAFTGDGQVIFAQRDSGDPGGEWNGAPGSGNGDPGGIGSTPIGASG